jgi:nucleoside-diphosphate-sugar epimerase
MESDFTGPVNIGSEEMVTILTLAGMIAEIAGKKFIRFKMVPGPRGVMGRNSDNRLIEEKLGWSPSYSLYDGLVKTYDWILEQVQNHKLLEGESE